jgi:hypothetical protein
VLVVVVASGPWLRAASEEVAVLVVDEVWALAALRVRATRQITVSNNFIDLFVLGLLCLRRPTARVIQNWFVASMPPCGGKRSD